MEKQRFVETHNAFWVKLGEQLLVPVCKSTRILRRRPNGTEFITVLALQPGNKTIIVKKRLKISEYIKIKLTFYR